MPIYEYRCKKCENKFDALQRVGADGKDLNCPRCGEREPERLISVFSSSGTESSVSSASCSPEGGFT